MKIEGLDEFSIDLRQMRIMLADDVLDVLKDGAKDVARDAAARAPKGRTHKLANSIEAGSTPKSAYVRSRLAYASVHDRGGRVGRNHSVFIRPTRFMTGALDDNADQIISKVSQRIEETARRRDF